MKAPHIYYVSSHKHGFAGGESALLELAMGVQRLGWDATFVDTVNNPSIQEEVKNCSVRLKVLECSDISRNGRQHLLDAVKADRVSLCHFNNRRDVLLSNYIKKRHEIPMVVTLYNNFTSLYLSLKNNTKGILMMLLCRCLGGSFDRYIAVSEFAANRFRQDLKIAHRKVIPIYSAVNSLKERSLSFQEISKSKNLCCVANLYKHKGIDILIEALSHCKDLEWTCRIMGDGPERDNLQALVSRLGLKERVLFLGKIPRTDVLDYVSQSRMMILPSYYEGLPLSLLESMSLGVPIITSNINGFNEIIPEGRNGCLFEPGNVSELSVTIKTLLSDDELIANMSIESQKLSEGIFSLDTMVSKTVELYRELLSSFPEVTSIRNG